MRELPIPLEAETAKQADEILRGWIINQRLFCSLRPAFWAEEPEAWGILLADVFQHVCDSLHQETGKDKTELKNTILEAFKAEIEAPTGNHTGEFYGE